AQGARRVLVLREHAAHADVRVADGDLRNLLGERELRELVGELALAGLERDDAPREARVLRLARIVRARRFLAEHDPRVAERQRAGNEGAERSRARVLELEHELERLADRDRRRFAAPARARLAAAEEPEREEEREHQRLPWRAARRAKQRTMGSAES